MKPARPSMAYPFTTRRQVLDRLDHDAGFVTECIELLHRRYQDRAALVPPAGWMASHVKVGEQVHQLLSSGAPTASDIDNAARLARRYSKQISICLRGAELAANPGLGLAAAVFGVHPPQELDDADDPYAEREDDAAGEDAAKAASSSQPASAAEPGELTPAVAAVGKPAAVLPAGAKKRGRPPGSKNKKASPARRRTRS